MSFWSRPRNLMILGAGIVGAFFVPTPWSKSTHQLLVSIKSFPPETFTNSPADYSNPFETQGTRNIADRWSAGGGSDVHTPGAATPRGNSAATTPNQKDPKGINTEHFQEHQISQRPGEPGAFDKQWNKSHYGTEKGK
ncbi:hypothetical protein E4T44_06026 [Aureobasidium sp. EXF-8845]|nr:hypothetical protein E4T44_06026 [Aureobasidium sp. EXF-8845]